MSKKTTLNFHEVSNAAMPEVAQASMAVVNQLQSYHPEIQCLGLAVTFRTFCEVANVNPSEIMTYAANIIHHRDGEGRIPLRAVETYMRKELDL